MMTRLTVQLPYPDAALNPNARTHWAAKGKATKEARDLAHVETLNAMHGLSPTARDAIRMAPAFRVRLAVIWPKLNRRRDVQNAFAATKAYVDGIADGLGVNDSLFRAWEILPGEAVADGQVIFMVDPEN